MAQHDHLHGKTYMVKHQVNHNKLSHYCKPSIETASSLDTLDVMPHLNEQSNSQLNDVVKIIK